jgi:hypothetical protein
LELPVKRLGAPAAAAALIIGLAGCSGTPQAAGVGTAGSASPAAPAPAPTFKGEPAGKFALKTKSGAAVTFNLPTPATDPNVAPIEAYRVKTGAAPVTYLIADVDNRNGTQPVNMYRVMAFDKQGHEYDFSLVWNLVNSWEPVFGEDYKWKTRSGAVLDDATGQALSNEGNDLQNTNLNGADIGARKTLVLASKSTDLPSEFTRVAVMPSGAFGEEEATPAP